MSKVFVSLVLLASICAMLAASVHAAMQLPSVASAEHHVALGEEQHATSPLSLGTRVGAHVLQAPEQLHAPVPHEESMHEEIVSDSEDQRAFVELHAAEHAMRRTSSPYLHELRDRVEAETEDMLDEDLMVRVEGPETAKEIRERLAPYLHPRSHQLLKSEPAPPPLVSQASQRALRTQHMKHVMEMKYRKQHAAELVARAHADADASGKQGASAAKVTSVSNHTVHKSPEDDRSYRFITLENGLRAVLVSDPNTTKSAAAIDVGNGYLSDPADLPGLAHFLEHMLFLGTDKYPSEAEYADFIESHGGFSNAYTAMENTNYYFDILPTHLVPALDRFAQFFIAPKLNVNTTGREAGAVDSEHSKNLQSDAWRTNRLLQDVANRTHPYSKFGTGCRRTLSVRPGEEMVAALRKFWTQHYTAGNLFLSVLGAESLDVLQATVDKYFSAIKPTPKEGAFRPLANTTPKQVFNSSVLGSQLFVNTIEDSKFLSLIFPVESQFPTYRKQSLAYLRALVENRGTNSLLKQLKQRGLATNIQLGIDAGTTAFATIQFGVDLTTKGGEHIDEIVAAFFATLAHIADHGVEGWRYEEMARIANLTFTFKDKEQPSKYISKLSSNLRHYPPEDLLVGGRLFQDFDAGHIRHLLASMNVDNMMLLVGGKELNHRMRFKEQWYGIEYDVERIANERIQGWKAATARAALDKAGWKFALPGKSAFIPASLKVNPPLLNPVPRPIVLYESDRNESEHTGAKRLWFSEDLEFHRPHGHAVFRFYVPSIYSSPRNYLLTSIYANLLEDQIDEELYAALMAGFSAHLRVGSCFLDLIFYGYNAGLVQYGESIAKLMNPSVGFKPDAGRFEMFKESLLNSYLNKKYDAPHRQSTLLLSSLLDPKLISHYDLVRTLQTIQFADVESWARVLYGDMSLEAYVHGNVAPEAAQNLLQIFVRHLPFRTTSTSFVNVPSRNHYLPRPRLGQVKEDVRVEMAAPNAEETNSAIVKYWQYGMAGVEGKLYSQLLALIAQKPIFHQLRTKEQLGYIVWSSADNRLDVTGFKIQVQSGRRPAAYLNDRIDAFMLEFQHTLRNMTQRQFEGYVQTLMMSKLQSPVSMAVQTAWFWTEISRQEYIFQRREIELYLLNATSVVNFAGFQNFVQRLFYISDPHNPGVQACEQRGGGALSVRVESSKPQKPAPKAAANIKSHAGLHPGAKKKARKPIGTSPPVAQVRRAAAARKAAKKKSKLTPAVIVQSKQRTPAPKQQQHKSLLEHGAEHAAGVDATTDAALEAEVEAALDVEAEVAAETEAEAAAAAEAEAEAVAAAEAQALQDLGLLAEAGEEDESLMLLELEGDVKKASKPAPAPKRRAIIPGGPFATSAKGKSLSVSALDQPVKIVTRTRTGALYVLNTRQSAVHIFTDSMMLYPRNHYESPPAVRVWKNVKPKARRPRKVKITVSDKAMKAIRTSKRADRSAARQAVHAANKLAKKYAKKQAKRQAHKAAANIAKVTPAAQLAAALPDVAKAGGPRNHFPGDGSSSSTGGNGNTGAKPSGGQEQGGKGGRHGGRHGHHGHGGHGAHAAGASGVAGQVVNAVTNAVQSATAAALPGVGKAGGPAGRNVGGGSSSSTGGNDNTGAKPGGGQEKEQGGKGGHHDHGGHGGQGKSAVSGAVGQIVNAVKQVIQDATSALPNVGKAGGPGGHIPPATSSSSTGGNENTGAKPAGGQEQPEGGKGGHGGHGGQGKNAVSQVIGQVVNAIKSAVQDAAAVLPHVGKAGGPGGHDVGGSSSTGGNDNTGAKPAGGHSGATGMAQPPRPRGKMTVQERKRIADRKKAAEAAAAAGLKDKLQGATKKTL